MFLERYIFVGFSFLTIGHTKQGLRCRICKTNVHADCVPQLGKCQMKAKLLRRQKSTSEIENRIEADEESKYRIFFLYCWIVFYFVSI